VDVIIQGSREGHDTGKMLMRMGYVLIETVYARVLHHSAKLRSA
jgi:hypothetical protein